MYVDGGLNRTTWEAQRLEHRFISEGRGIKLLLGRDSPLRLWFEQDHLVAQGGSQMLSCKITVASCLVLRVVISVFEEG